MEKPPTALTDVERMAAYQLAIRHDAPKTAATIQDHRACYPEIMSAALAEMGIQKLSALIDHLDRPEWTWACLRHCHRQIAEAQRSVFIERIARSADNSCSLLRIIGHELTAAERAPLVKAVAARQDRARVLLGYHRHQLIRLTDDEAALLSRTVPFA